MYINLCQTVGSCCGGKICNSKFGTVTYSCSARIFFMLKTKPVISVLELIFLYALNVALVLLVSNAIYLITYSRYSRSHRRSSSRTVGPSQADLDFDQWFSFLLLTVNTFDRQTICVHIVWRLKYNLFFFFIKLNIQYAEERGMPEHYFPHERQDCFVWFKRTDLVAINRNFANF